MSDVTIRPERQADQSAIFEITRLAFGRDDEGKLIDAIRAGLAPHLSLVADRNGEVVGHVLFTPVIIPGGGGSVDACGLGPMAVHPKHQRKGIGSSLVRSGLQAVREEGHSVVVVLGHPEYYPRFGFVPAHTMGLTCEFEVPPEVFMALELTPGALAGRRGVVKYLPEFSRV